jgi:hypothetical protein
LVVFYPKGPAAMKHPINDFEALVRANFRFGRM